MRNPLTKNEHAALEGLVRALDRDTEKGGIGVRTTREIADYTGLSLRSTRYVLHGLAHMDLADCFAERPLEWRITSKGITLAARLRTGEG